MACSISSGRARGCKENVGGIKNIYLVNFISDLADSTITAGVASVSGTPDAYKFELKGAVNSFEQVGEVSRDNGSVFYNQTLTGVFPSMDASDLEELEDLAKGNPQALVEDYNGNVFIAGYENGLDVQITAGSGAAMGDLNGFTIVFTGQEKKLAVGADLTDFTIS